MKKGDKFILLLLSLVALLMVAAIGYRLLTERYSPLEIPFTVAENEDTSLADYREDDSANSENKPSTDTTGMYHHTLSVSNPARRRRW